MEISHQGNLEHERNKKMRTTSVGYGQHPRRTAALVALVVVSLTATTTGSGLVMAAPASAQALATAGPPVAHRPSPVEASRTARYENEALPVRAVPRAAGLGPASDEGLSAVVRDVRGAGLGSAPATATSAPDAPSTGPGP
jgi:hypothetical protein